VLIKQILGSGFYLFWLSHFVGTPSIPDALITRWDGGAVLYMLSRSM
jgi:hypothetical protein